MKIILIIGLLFFIKTSVYAQSPEVLIQNILTKKCITGAVYEYQENSGEIIEIPSTRGAAALPSNFSLKEFVPKVLQQEGGSCASFASTYYGFSIYERFRQNNKLIEPFDPVFAYSRNHNFYNLPDSLEEGFSLGLNLLLLKDFGCPKSTNDILIEKRNPIFEFPEKLESFKQLNNTYSNLEQIKYSLSKGNPVAVSMATNLSLQTYTLINVLKNPINNIDNLSFIKIMRGKNSESCKKYTDNELSMEYQKIISSNEYYWIGKYPEKGEGSHAICIIGYDDNKFGGAFEIVNSWGDDFANGGFIWIKYKDFYNMFPQFYQIGK